MNIRSRALAGRLLCVVLAACATAAQAQPVSRPATAPSSQPVTVKVPARPWQTMPAWQDAPDGHGQYLLLPSPHGQFEIAGRQYLATQFGVLSRALPATAPATQPPATRLADDWKIVPELYLKHLEPIAVRQGLLWAVEGRPQLRIVDGRLAAQAPETVRVVALDPTDWSTKKTIQMPAGSRVIKVEKGGFWLVEQGTYITGFPGPGRPGDAAIAFRNFAGKETLRFEAKTLATDSPGNPPGVHAKPIPQIWWWAIDDDAVYLSVIDFRGVSPRDAHVYGPRQLVRVDRATGKHVAVDANIYPDMPMVDTPDRILWHQSQHKDGKYSEAIYQLDKKAMKIAQAAILEDCKRIAALATDGRHLWVLEMVFPQPEPKAFSLKDFQPVVDPGRPPAPETFMPHRGYRPPPFMPPSAPVSTLLLGGDAARLWVVHGTSLLELRDDDKLLIRDIKDRINLEQTISAVCTAGKLYAASGGQVARIIADSEDVVLNNVSLPPGAYHMVVAASDRYIWSLTGEELLTFNDKLQLIHRSERPKQTTIFSAIEGSLYCFGDIGGRCEFMRIDATTGVRTVVESWRRHAKEWFQAAYGRHGPSENDIWSMTFPMWMVADGGKLQVLCIRPGSPVRKALIVRTMLWTYDIASDSWQHEDIPMHSSERPWNAGMLFDTAKSVLLMRKGGAWVSLGKLPKGWFEYAGHYYWRVHVTGKHVYAWTPLGLWRTARKEEPATMPATAPG